MERRAHHSHHHKHATKSSSKVYVETSHEHVESAATSATTSGAHMHPDQHAIETAPRTTGETPQKQQQTATSRSAMSVPLSGGAVISTTAADTTTSDCGRSTSDRNASRAVVTNSTAAIAANARGEASSTAATAVRPVTRLQQAPGRFVSRLSHDISIEQLLSDDLIDGKVVDSDDDDDDDAHASGNCDGSDDDNHDGDQQNQHSVSKTARNNSRPRKLQSISDAALDDHIDDDNALQCPPTKGLYRIESHSALSSLESKNLDKPQQPQQQSMPSTRSDTAATVPVDSSNEASAFMSSMRVNVPKPHKLLPLSGGGAATTTTAAIDKSSLSPTQCSALPAHTAVTPARSDLIPPATATADTHQEPNAAPCAACTSHHEMPPMHCAAYAGHVACLEALLLLQLPSATSASHELDKKHRTPLFYACAANRMACAALLLTHRPHWRDLPDKQLDTPVHVCCFFGWHACLAQLLDAGADPHVRNAKGFKPSHIATSKDCLALLLSFGDDLLQGDKLGRTPLFVASARDRAACVEFLCAWNHQSRSWMLEQEDQRGDRPIHAAACNGSVAALEVLLKYGADPRSANAKALTPKDLASANNHVPCVELLMRAEDELARAATWFAPANAVGSGENDNNNCAVDRSGEYGGSSDSSSGGGNDSTIDVNSSHANGRGWIECWDYDSSQPFYYHNLSGKCQWEVPSGFTPQLLQRERLGGSSNGDNDVRSQHTSLAEPTSSSSDNNNTNDNDNDNNGASGSATDNNGDSNSVEDDGSEYVWVKKKKQTVCVVTSKATEWTAVQDPASRAIYYKNTRTGQSQWEEPDAVQQLQSASGAHAAQEATRIWDELDQCRSTLAATLARDKHRQLAAQQQALERYKLHIRERREEMQKREEQARLQQLLPRSSFVRRKKQSMMMKITPPDKRTTNSSVNVTVGIDDERLEQICAKEPALDLFLSTYVKLQGVRDLQIMSTERRFGNCLFHYYVALADPVASGSGLSKSHFRAFLRDAAIIPTSAGGATASLSSSSSSSLPPPLKLHVVDLIFAQATRAEALELMSGTASPGSPQANKQQQQQSATQSYAMLHHRQAAATAVPTPGDAASRLTLTGFLTAMQIVRDRVVTQVESRNNNDSDGDNGNDNEIDDDEEWFLTTFLLPLTLKLGAKLLTQIRECKELDLQIAASHGLRTLLTQQRPIVQMLHRHYSSEELRLKMLTFRGLSHFVLEFNVLQCASLPSLHQLYEAVNWISGNAHTEIISFEKFQQLLTMLACFRLSTGSSNGSSDNVTGGTTAIAGSGSSDCSNSSNGQMWRAVARFSPQAPGGVGASPASNSSDNERAESEHRVLEALREFFQQLERSPAKHRIQAEVTTASASAKLLAASAPSQQLQLSRMGQSSRAMVGGSSIRNVAGFGANAGAAAGDVDVGASSTSSSHGLIRAPSTPAMAFRAY